MDKKTRILVVDDEQYIRKLVERTLQDAGYSVSLALDGNSALAMLAESEPDLVLLDIKMPGIDGYQVLKRIRETSNIPVMMLTAVRGEAEVEKSLNLGADDFITKPFSSRVMVSRIRAKLRRISGELRKTGDQTADSDSPS